MRILFSLILVILLIIFSIYLAVLNPDPISLTLPLIGHFKDVPTIVVILSSILLGVAIAFVVMVAKETTRTLSSWRENRRRFPAASDSESRSAGRLSVSRRCSFSMNRFQTWMPSCADRCARRSQSCTIALTRPSCM